MLHCGKEFIYVCPCPEILNKAEYKGDGLINLSENIFEAGYNIQL